MWRRVERAVAKIAFNYTRPFEAQNPYYEAIFSVKGWKLQGTLQSTCRYFRATNKFVSSSTHLHPALFVRFRYEIRKETCELTVVGKGIPCRRRQVVVQILLGVSNIRSIPIAQNLNGTERATLNLYLLCDKIKPNKKSGLAKICKLHPCPQPFILDVLSPHF